MPTIDTGFATKTVMTNSLSSEEVMGGLKLAKSLQPSFNFFNDFIFEKSMSPQEELHRSSSMIFSMSHQLSKCEPNRVS